MLKQRKMFLGRHTNLTLIFRLKTPNKGKSSLLFLWKSWTSVYLQCDHSNQLAKLDIIFYHFPWSCHPNTFHKYIFSNICFRMNFTKKKGPETKNSNLNPVYIHNPGWEKCPFILAPLPAPLPETISFSFRSPLTRQIACKEKSIGRVPHPPHPPSRDGWEMKAVRMTGKRQLKVSRHNLLSLSLSPSSSLWHP